MMRDYFIRVTAAGDEQAVRRKLDALFRFGTISDAIGDAGVDAIRVSLLAGATNGESELGKLWDLAAHHGYLSEADHEVGDLQELTRVCWELLSDESRQAVAAAFRDHVQTATE